MRQQEARRPIMDEIFPVLSGFAVGLVLAVVRPRFRMLASVVLAIVLGTLVSWSSGELAIAWVYALIDTAQVVGAALLTSALVGRWRQRAWRLP
jgi:DNA helicase HerA-like ATPase